jgi:cold shock CspA family protein/ribosome-associated translation inhibitor RaiA
MQATPSISFRGLADTAALETEIATRLRKLEIFYDRIMNCRVLVELVQQHHSNGNHYHVRIDLTVPGEEIVVSHEVSLRGVAQDLQAETLRKASEPDPGRKDVHVAIHQAFDVARRRLQDFARRQRGSVKTRSLPSHGRIARLVPGDEQGYIEADDGRDVYFHRNSVLRNAFDRMVVGSDVAFAEERGEKGPQASTVRLLHPRRARRARIAALSTR